MKLIFIVEDDALFIVKLKAIFALLKFEVDLVLAKNSTESVKLYKEQLSKNSLPDLILIDTGLKKSRSQLTGFEVGKIYRELSDDVLIFMIGTKKKEVEIAKSNMMNGYILKKGEGLRGRLSELKEDYLKFKNKELTWKEYVT